TEIVARLARANPAEQGVHRSLEGLAKQNFQHLYQGLSPPLPDEVAFCQPQPTLGNHTVEHEAVTHLEVGLVLGVEGNSLVVQQFFQPLPECLGSLAEEPTTGHLSEVRPPLGVDIGVERETFHGNYQTLLSRCARGRLGSWR